MDKELIQEAISKLTIKQIALRQSDFKISKEYDPVIGSGDIKYQMRGNLISVETLEIESDEAEADQGLGTVRFIVETAIRILPGSVDTPEEEDSSVLVELIAQHAMYFNLLTNDASDECLKEFGKINCLFQVWPYWRELVQSHLAKAQIPVFALPMFKIE